MKSTDMTVRQLIQNAHVFDENPIDVASEVKEKIWEMAPRYKCIGKLNGNDLFHRKLFGKDDYAVYDKQFRSLTEEELTQLESKQHCAQNRGGRHENGTN